MLEKEVTLTNEVGLHARPAAVFAKAANDFACEVVVIKQGAEANAKSMLSVLKLDVRKGDRIVLRTNGKGEQLALDELVALVDSL